MTFAFLPLPEPRPNHTEALAQFATDYAAFVTSSAGNVTPYVYPYRLFGPLLLILYLLIPPTTSKLVFYVRYPLFAFISYLATQAFFECRSNGPASGYLIGLSCAWSTLWGATLVIFSDARSDFKRIERRTRSRGEDDGGADHGREGAVASGRDGDEKQARRRRDDQNGILSSTPKAHSSPPADLQQITPRNGPLADDSTYYVWQGLPPTFLHRLGWVLDLVSNFRGLGWNYQNASLPPPPSHILSTLRPPFPHNPLPPANAPTRASFIRSTLIAIPVHYLMCDAGKYLILHDPYFFAYPAPSSSSPYPFPTFTRPAISVFVTYVALSTLFCASQTVHGVLGPSVLGFHADPIPYYAYFGSLSHTATKGIGGLWALSWHQMFRFAFDSAGDFIAKPLGAGWRRKTAKGGILRLFTAFVLSGFLHAAGSYTNISNTRPLSPFLFFAVQPFGILAQRLFSWYLRRSGWRDRLPLWSRRAGNLACVVAWAYATGFLVSDDFARARVWLFEPMPYSLWRGKWVWHDILGTWYDGGGTARWWERGYAL
ncbi:hypothetical protein MMC07_000953 [Pseudocyphellaria aurata]|nr:hypothetical protein [Pseudocyphellaria aurata]